MSFKNMVKIRCLLLCLVLLSVSSVAQPTKKVKSISVLVIGNSFSRNATTYLPQLAKEGGHELTIKKAEISGGRLNTHWEAVEAFEANPDDPKGKPYGGKSLKMLLLEGRVDLVTMQQGSVISANPDSYYPYIQNLYNYIKKLQPDAEIVLHQTWAYRNDANYYSTVKDSTRAKSQQEMYEKSRAAYHSVAKQLGVRIIPTGDAFWLITKDPRWTYKKDANFNFSKPNYPELPDQKNSLNVGYTWTTKKVFKLDANHANEAGCYLGSLTWYSFLFNQPPLNLKFTPENVSADFAVALRKAAAETVRRVESERVSKSRGRGGRK